MIIHSVLFKLKHKKGSAEEQRFLIESLSVLSRIAPYFKIYNEVSFKNDFDFYFYMAFKSQKEYDSYNSNPAHLEYVQSRWVPEVADFMEVDLIEYDNVNLSL